VLLRLGSRRFRRRRPGKIRSRYCRSGGGYPDMRAVLPSLGYSDAQGAALEETLCRSTADVIVDASLGRLDRVLHLSIPIVHARYRFQEKSRPANFRSGRRGGCPASSNAMRATGLARLLGAGLVGCPCAGTSLANGFRYWGETAENSQGIDNATARPFAWAVGSAGRSSLIDFGGAHGDYRNRSWYL
jgi:hypothetical protein